MASIRTRALRRLRSSRGSTLVEAAFITPLLLLLTFSIVDFAAILYVFLSLESGVTQATRFAITGEATPGMTRDQAIMNAMRQATPTLTLADTDFTFTHMRPGATVWTNGPGGPGDIGRVTVNYHWNVMTPLIRPFFTNGRINVRVESAMKNEAAWN